MRGRRWDLRNGGGLFSGSSSNTSSSSSDDLPPEDMKEKEEPRPPEIAFDSTMFLSGDDSISDYLSDQEPSTINDGAKKSKHFLDVIEELNEATRARMESTSEHSETEPPAKNISLSSSDPEESSDDSSSEEEPIPEPAKKRVMTSLTRTPPDKQSKGKAKEKPKPRQSDRKTMYVDTVKAIHDFFQGTYSIETILQAIHGCAGDYRAATKKLVSGFRGCSILEIPTTVQSSITPDQLRRYLRGDD